MRSEVRVVADTNILISALLFGGHPGQVFLAGLRGEIQLLPSLFLLKELEKVLKEKFKLSIHLVRQVIEEVRAVAEIVEVSSHIEAISYPDEDNRILECAIDGRADFIVTGDTKHILPLKEYGGIKILSASEFLKHLPTGLL
ncbi:MAG: putative toxin-antitoxin system toxin component, PIN family [Thermodesulfobacteriota bacterium]